MVGLGRLGGMGGRTGSFFWIFEAVLELLLRESRFARDINLDLDFLNFCFEKCSRNE
jgi:hypothetical protein